jgi:hypothetical protein
VVGVGQRTLPKAPKSGSHPAFSEKGHSSASGGIWPVKGSKGASTKILGFQEWNLTRCYI